MNIPFRAVDIFVRGEFRKALKTVYLPLNDELNHFIELNSEKKDFYGQEITDEVLSFIKENPEMLAPVREGNKLYCMAFPDNMKEYLKTTDEKMM